jgi:hypothetical protein
LFFRGAAAVGQPEYPERLGRRAAEKQKTNTGYRLTIDVSPLTGFENGEPEALER